MPTLRLCLSGRRISPWQALKVMLCLHLNEVIRFLGYKRLREIDESSRKTKEFDTNVLLAASEGVSHF